jgi:prepilin-type N-terminal cleavage/methylation domain-containing protein
MDAITMSIRKGKSERGFSLIEMMIATVVIAIGLLSMIGLFAKSLAIMQYAQEGIIAKQKAREALEGVYAARDDSSLNFTQIDNFANGGIFKDGFVSMMINTTTGISGTTSDSATPDSVLIDGVNVPLANYQRQILFSPIPAAGGGGNDPSIKQVTVTVRVFSPGGRTRDYNVTGYVSKFR